MSIVRKCRHFSITLALGAVKYPTREMAFSDSIFGCSLFGKLMTMDRFNHILNAWHLLNYDGKSDAEVAALKQINPFWAIKTLSIILAKSFNDYYQFRQLLDLYERCIPWIDETDVYQSLQPILYIY